MKQARALLVAGGAGGVGGEGPRSMALTPFQVTPPNAGQQRPSGGRVRTGPAWARSAGLSCRAVQLALTVPVEAGPFSVRTRRGICRLPGADDPTRGSGLETGAGGRERPSPPGAPGRQLDLAPKHPFLKRAFP